MMFKIVDDATASQIETEVKGLEEERCTIEGVTLIHVGFGLHAQKYTAVIKYQPTPSQGYERC